MSADITPPEDRVSGIPAEVPEVPPAVLSFRIETLKNRPDFLRAAQARRQGTAGFLVQARARGDDRALVRVGFTASKKIGNAVARNLAKRRLREVARAVLPDLGRPGWDYVLVARPGVTTTRVYALLLTDLATALRSLHG